MYASKDDHRRIAEAMDLFHMQEESPGMVFWHAAGLRLHHNLEAAVRARLDRRGFEEVRSPQLLRRSIWESSGHAEAFSSAMFEFEERPGVKAALKPVSCPGHAQIFARRVVSHRDLPVRIAEFGVCHRNERSGSLQGLFRLRQFVQDDGHVFCRPDQVSDELDAFIEDLLGLYQQLELPPPEVHLAGRPPDGMGDDEGWAWAESVLRDAVERAELSLHDSPGEGAFYAPKLEFRLADSSGRMWQCGTIQVDVVMPERFDLSYVDAHDERRRPVMLHRAWLGSLERMLALLLERHGGRLPLWLSRQPLVVLPISELENGFAEHLVERLRARSLPAEIWDSDASLGRRIALAHERRIEAVAIIGARERQAGEVSLRRADEQWCVPIDVALDDIESWYRAPVPAAE